MLECFKDNYLIFTIICGMHYFLSFFLFSDKEIEAP